MWRYLLSRVAGVIGVLLAVSAITFFLMHSVPEGPFDIMSMDKSVTIPDGVKKQLEAAYGLDFYDDRNIKNDQNPAFNGKYQFTVHLFSLAYRYSF